jgi:DNA polymerase-3 subunit beta
VKIAARASGLNAALSLATTGIRGSKNQSVRVVAGGNAVAFICSAPGIAIKVSADANVDAPGDVTVSDHLGGLIGGVPSNGTVTITTTPNAAMVACGSGIYRLPIIHDAPAAIAMDYENARIELPADDLLTLLKAVSAASVAEGRPYLNGLHLHSGGDKLVGVASDGVKLVRVAVAADHFSDDPRLILPTKSVTALARLTKQAKADDRLTLRRSGALFAVTGPNFEFITSMLDYKYPQYERMLPRPSTNVALINRAELVGALARLKAVARTEPLPLIALSWTDGEAVRLSLPQQPGDAMDAIPAEARGSVRIALALLPLTEMIASFSADRLQLEGTDPDGPLVMHGEQNKLGLLTSCRWNLETREPSP